MQGSWLRKQSGQAVILVAVAVLVLTAILMLALDGGGIYLDKRQIQNAADASALAGAELLMAVPLNYTNIHNQAINNLVKNLSGTSLSGTVCSPACPNQATIGAPGGNGVGTISLGSGYYAELSATTAYNYQVIVWHVHPVALGPVHGFQSTITLSARATAQNEVFPYAIVLLQSGASPTYSDLQMSGTGTALNLSGPGGSNSADRGGVFSNASIDPGTGDIYFGPCTSGPPVNTTGPGTSGDLWAVSETGTDAGRVSTEAFCGQTAPGSYKTPAGILPDPNYPEPAAPNITNPGANVINGNTVVCPGHYSNGLTVNGTEVLYPGVYHIDAGGVTISGTLRTFQNTDTYPVTNPCGTGTTLQSWGSFDPGVIIEVVPANASLSTQCAKHLFTTTGSSSSVTLSPSPKYFNISLYIEEMPGWQTTCTANAKGTNVVRLTGSGYYNIQGLIYGPADNMQIGGGASGSGVGQIVAWTLMLNGGGTINENYNPNQLPYLKGLIQ